MNWRAVSRASPGVAPRRRSLIMEAEAVLIAQPWASKRTAWMRPSGARWTSTLMESPQVGFSWALAWGMWSRRAAPRGRR